MRTNCKLETMWERVRDKERDALIGLRIYMHIYFVRRCSHSLTFSLSFEFDANKKKINQCRIILDSRQHVLNVDGTWIVHRMKWEMLRWQTESGTEAETKIKWKSDLDLDFISVSPSLSLSISLSFAASVCYLPTPYLILALSARVSQAR